MNQIIAIALGGASGSVVRFLVSTGVYQWLGRDFPYGTFAVNLIGCFLMGLLAEALVLQRISLVLEFRAAILVGVLGGFTTFSSFSIETIYLLEEGSYTKAMMNIFGSVVCCLFATWIGLLFGRALFYYSGGILQWSNGALPYAMMVVNAVLAFLIGLVATILFQKVVISMEHRAIIMVFIVGVYLTLTGLYLIFYFIEHGYTFDAHMNLIVSVFAGNSLICIAALWSGLLIGRQI